MPTKQYKDRGPLTDCVGVQGLCDVVAEAARIPGAIELPPECWEYLLFARVDFRALGRDKRFTCAVDALRLGNKTLVVVIRFFNGDGVRIVGVRRGGVPKIVPFVVALVGFVRAYECVDIFIVFLRSEGRRH